MTRRTTDAQRPRIRLDALAAACDPAAELEGRREGGDEHSAKPEAVSPGALSSPLPGRSGRLVERWVPGGGRTVGTLTRLLRRRASLVAVVLGGVLAAVGLVSIGLAAQRPRAEAPPPLPAAVLSTAPPVTTGPTPATATHLVISVVGKVATPGLVTVQPGARVADAITAAGGARRGADLTALNLARRLADGEQIYVGIPAPPAARRAATAPAAAGAANPAPLNINTATADQLDTLPGVGAVTAQKILDWRAEHGRFRNVGQLRDVDGIGDSKFADLKDLVTVQ